ncbi:MULTISPECIES: DegV family protein [Paenibacillus]|uniref:DegV family protein n=1 Tax=Paenibacillus TaxID=44249 RepID=UPI00037C3BC8|nr:MULTISPECIES: DegV family protein [Paenibacillus]
MNSIRIFADSTCDLPASWLDEHQVGIVPLYVTFGEQVYRDGVDIKPADLYQRVQQQGQLPKTSAPSPADFIQAFAPVIEAGQDIIYISLSSALSSTYANARIAAEEWEEGRVNVLDSLNLSSSIGLLVMKAVHAAAAGASVQEIIRLLTDMRGRIETEFAIDSLEYLYKGGRCSGMQNLIGSLLKIRPVIEVTPQGTLVPAYKVRGKREKAVEQLLRNAIANADRLDEEVIFVVHSFAEEEAKMMQAVLREQTNARQVMITEAGCVISSHCGPQTIAIMYATQA